MSKNSKIKNKIELKYQERKDPIFKFNLNTFLLEVLLISIGIIFNFIPSLLSTNKSFFKQVFALNTFLGWTFVGWVICLVWSLKIEKSEN